MGTFVAPDKICTAVSVLSGVVLFLESFARNSPTLVRKPMGTAMPFVHGFEAKKRWQAGRPVSTTKKVGWMQKKETKRICWSTTGK